jgi:hypothetical protein
MLTNVDLNKENADANKKKERKNYINQCSESGCEQLTLTFSVITSESKLIDSFISPAIS